MKRQISRTAFNLAGGGWHAQGYSGTGAGKKARGRGRHADAPAAPAGRLRRGLRLPCRPPRTIDYSHWWTIPGFC